MEVKKCKHCGEQVLSHQIYCSFLCHEQYLKQEEASTKLKEDQKHWRPSDEKVVSEAGATQSKVAERYDLLCPASIRRLARRYALGAEKHSEFNYCLGGDDQKFQRARINHAIKHMMLYLEMGNFDENGNPDDNLAAAMWGVATTIHFEEGCEHHLSPIPGNAMTDPRFVEEKKKVGKFKELLTKIWPQRKIEQ